MEQFTFFWGGPFSQFYPCKFTAEVAGKTLEFNCAEQYMMYCKAMCFKGREVLKPDEKPISEKILETTLAKDAKALGRKVPGFDDDLWMTVAKGIVYTGNYHKFTQNPELKAELLATKGTTLVEASPVDRRWGIGLSSSDPRSLHRNQWRGTNLLGQVLTELRDNLLKEEAKD